MYAAATLTPSVCRADGDRSPNVVVLLADDLGFSDLGCYGSEISTPHLDRLAAHGLRYSQFYNTARCWPTRAALLTGYYAQQVRADELPSMANSRGDRPEWARLLPHYLRMLGYRSYHAGKWHLTGGPIEGGFDRSYALNDHDRHFHPQEHTLDDRPLPPVAPEADYYATTEIANRAIEFLQEHQSLRSSEPFFAYVAFTAPHFPLQAPEADIAEYRFRYREGWDAIRAKRWKRLRDDANIPGALSPREPKIGPPYDFPRDWERLGSDEVPGAPAWNALDASQKTFQAAKMAIHAAMVSRLDAEVGRILEQVRRMEAWENTLILFLSDNGASAEIMIRGDNHNPQAPLGGPDSFLCLGPGWSNAANTPYRRHKTWVHEGGIATPLIVHWPHGIPNAGQWRASVGHAIDIAPTILDAAGWRQARGDWAPRRHDGSLAPVPPGRSLCSTWSADQRGERQLWWLHEGNRAIRQGDWKLVAARDAPWELYDLGVDRTEVADLANAFPERVTALADAWQKQLQSIAGDLEPSPP